MAIELNHTIVYSRDKHEGARFLTDLLGLPAASTWGPFATVQLANQVTLDYLDADGNTHDGGRGVYFDDPSGHKLEIITRPYGDER